ncbi:MAG: protein of unknown function duf20 [Verrucomicrobiales bacterium]|nr:protein of unknown function duf20 [Verrucomicrobiales bacterium]
MQGPTPRQSEIIWFSLTALAVTALLAVIGFIGWALFKLIILLNPVLLPLSLAALISYILDPLIVFLEKRKIERRRAVSLIFFSAIILVIYAGATILPEAFNEGRDLAQKTPGYVKAIEKKIEASDSLKNFKSILRQKKATPPSTPSIGPAAASVPTPENTEPTLGENAMKQFARLLPLLGSWASGQFERVSSYAAIFVGLFLVPIYVFYFLVEKNSIENSWTRYLPVVESRFKEELVFVLSAINDCLIVFYRGQVLVSLCSGAILTFLFLVMGLYYGILLGATAGLLGIVPFLGTAVSIVPATLLAWVQFEDLLHPGLVIGCFVLVQIVEGLFTTPRLVGNKVGLHPLTVIICVMVGTSLLGGIVGGLLAIPLTAALRAILYRYIWNKTTTAQLNQTL